MSTALQEPQTIETPNYLNAEYGWKSWLLTTDHKRIAVLYLISITVMFALGGVLNAAAMMFFQWRAYGSPFTPGHKMVETPAFSALANQGIFGLTMPSWEPFKLMSVDPSFGFFGMSPYMWLGLLAVPYALLSSFGSDHVRRVRRYATLVWMFAMLAIWLILSGSVIWRGGWTVGPRYLGAAPPFFAFGATCALEKLGRSGASARAAARGVAGGLALASVLSIGLVSLVFNTLPPELVHPLTQFALPLAGAGFVAHHVMEWIGWKSTTYWYIAAFALVASAFFAGTLRNRLSRGAFAQQLTIALLALWAGLRPQFAKQRLDEPADFDLRPFVTNWEPPGRDRMTSLRIEAQRNGSRQPCLWSRLADLESSLALTSDAARDRARAGTSASTCPRRFLGW